MTRREYLYEAEAQLLGGLIFFGFDDEYCVYALENLEPDDFCTEANKTVFAAMKKAFYDGGGADVVQIVKESGVSGEYLSGLISCATTVTNFKTYVSMLKARVADDRIVNGLNKVMLSEDKFTELERLYNEEKKYAGESSENIRLEYERSFVDFMEYITNPEAQDKRLCTGFTKLDSTLNGLAGGCISTIGAYPSTGKTALAVNIALNMFVNKVSVLFFSLEMSKNQIFARLAACACNIDYKKLNCRDISEEEKLMLTRYFGAVSVSQRLIIKDDEMYIEDIAACIARYKPEFVVIDYIQRIRTHKKTGTRRDEIDYISSEIKKLALHHRCHIMTLSQLARRGEGHVPNMDDLKESSALAQDNDYIFILHRPNVADKTKPAGIAHLTLDKNKFGETAVVKLNFDGKHQRFTEADA